jgi:hypothetical protein
VSFQQLRFGVLSHCYFIFVGLSFTMLNTVPYRRAGQMDTITTLVVASAVLGLSFVFIALIFLLLAARRGQQDVVRVKDHQGRAVAGIPFYVKRGRTIHETVYLETLADVTLTLTELTGDQDTNAGADVETGAVVYAATHTVSLSSGVQRGLAALQAWVAMLEATSGGAWNQKSWEAGRDVFEKLPVYDGHMPTSRNQVLPLVSNAVREESYVDYSRRYTLNATMPLIGSNELAVELAADGTLSKATAKAEDKMAATLLGALPSADLLGLIKPQKSDQPEKESRNAMLVQEKTGTRYNAQLTITRHYVRHWLWRPVVDSTFQGPIGQDQADDVWYRRETGVTPNQPAAPASTVPAQKPEEPKPSGG